jgi:hypothetical protein
MLEHPGDEHRLCDIGTCQLDLAMGYLDEEVLLALANQVSGYALIVASIIVVGFLLLMRNVIAPLRS